ncbi:hypothetical protein CH063_08885 [Colletotrichum higginsianum]|uniref:Uncharacterized protein n=1 Tax=Colletotrichum higginsianum (strain IMI 349063) TaxID=759273 RepID=H1VBI4_COLHI|nr:hypothetical protein CH63R_11769 [Colletotrichum higginsianum IMI 349063]OBR05066.1 hypothetical protein CH63R_11769 [Colletotrichum higginsianum IMI 349063]CCF37587.1 hypothetical protein CH063_08885 [Colletotrichum higginsianum]
MMGLHRLHTAHMEAKHEMRVDSQTRTSSNFPPSASSSRNFCHGTKGREERLWPGEFAAQDRFRYLE